MKSVARYFEIIQKQIEQIRLAESDTLKRASEWIATALHENHWLYVFGTGHSHILAEEVFFRAGGLVRAVPILDERLMLHNSASESSEHERKEGLASEILSRYPVEAGDVLIVASNSGRNAAPIEMVLEARSRGLKTIAIVNREHSNQWPTRHSSGKNLAEIADLVIDNCGIAGDACIDIEGMPSRVGPTSTITGAIIVNAVVIGAIELALGYGVNSEIYISSNSDGDAHNLELFRKYRARIRHL